METKICTICKTDFPKDREHFHIRKTKNGITFQNHCKQCHAEYRKKHYGENRERYIDKAKEYKADVVKWYKNYRENLSCSQCGEKRHWVLDFHHSDPSEKEFNISTYVSGSSKSKLLKEINKCIVLCANCHRDLHYKEKQANNA